MENISAGHIESFIIDNEKLYKQAKIQELSFYKELDNKSSQYSKENEKLKEFCPYYYGQETKNGNTYIIMENLFYKMPNASSIDFKLGRICYMPGDSQKKIDSEQKKTKKSTADSLGFKISGLQFKDTKGQIKKKLYRAEAYYTITQDSVESVCLELLKSNDSQEINKEALQHFISRLENIIKFFSECSTRFFIALSVFMLCDNILNKYSLHLIDFGHYGDLKPMEKDENVLEGLQSILKIFQNIQKQI